MNKRSIGIIFAVIISIIIVFGVLSEPASDIEKELPVFHVTLANPELYIDGIYSTNFLLPKGEFSLSFVPNGDSPKNLRIVIIGISTIYDEELVLDGTLHETNISEYYTWNYSGEKQFSNSKEQSVQIEINPNGNLIGTLSVDIKTP